MSNVMNFNDFVKEGQKYKSSKRNNIDPDVKIQSFQIQVENYIHSQGAIINQVGSDYEVRYESDVIAQVMFRPDYIGIKKNGSKFVDEFKYNEWGIIKKKLSNIIKEFKY